MCDNSPMFIRNFSVRSLFLLTTIVAVFSLILASAVRGSAAAGAICIAVLSLFVAFVNYILCFAAVAYIAERKRLEPRRPQSPFATATPPKQWLPPTD